VLESEDISLFKKLKFSIVKMVDAPGMAMLGSLLPDELSRN
jgi:hypothetical protein